ncbi:hypothetical protein CPB83DRAFT_773535, partial [Crepidotus variabilis]
EHWKTIANHVMQKEKGRCEAWKEEVDKLLVFSGLFSAVITGLLVESQKSLSEDSIKTLLTQLVAQGANQTVAAVAASGASGKFTASDSSKRVNALWFLSLVLSLATALFGIVAQQWLREHLRPSPENMPICVLPGLFHMYTEALDRFYVPHLFTALPLLLIISVVFFLIGMVDFLWMLNHQVAIPVTSVVFLVSAFLLFTTIYPALQPLPRQIPTNRSSHTSRAPCPYKSPQSWAFYKLVLFLRWAVVPPAFLRLGSVKSMSNFINLRFDELQAGWISHAVLWLDQRDLDLIKFDKDADLERLSTLAYTPHQATYGLYDTVRSLQVALRDLSSAEQ